MSNIHAEEAAVPSTSVLEWPYPAIYNAYEAGDRSFFETTSQVFFEQLNVVPPLFMRGQAFQVGEPYTHTDTGESVQAAFYCIGDRVFCRIETRNEFDPSKAREVIYARFFDSDPDGGCARVIDQYLESARRALAQGDEKEFGICLSCANENLASITDDLILNQCQDAIENAVRAAQTTRLAACPAEIQCEVCNRVWAPEVTDSQECPRCNHVKRYLIFQIEIAPSTSCIPLAAIIEVKGSDQSDYYDKVYRAFEELYPPKPYPYGDTRMFPLYDLDMIQGLYTHSELAGPHGADYYILALPDSTPEQIEGARDYIRRSFDAVSITVHRVKKLVPFEIPPREDKSIFAN